MSSLPCAPFLNGLLIFPEAESIYLCSLAGIGMFHLKASKKKKRRVKLIQPEWSYWKTWQQAHHWSHCKFWYASRCFLVLFTAVRRSCHLSKADITGVQIQIILWWWLDCLQISRSVSAYLKGLSCWRCRKQAVASKHTLDTDNSWA